ncbi:MAG: AAA domain-containing protein [Ferruginibacter sp.]
MKRVFNDLSNSLIKKEIKKIEVIKDFNIVEIQRGSLSSILGEYEKIEKQLNLLPSYLHIPNVSKPIIHKGKIIIDNRICILKQTLRAIFLTRKEFGLYIDKLNNSDYFERNLAFAHAILPTIQVFVTTCIGASNQYINNFEFDVTIIDEAGQIPIHHIMVPLNKSKKVILIGDHMQLPPLIDLEVQKVFLNNDETEWLDKTKKSLFEISFNHEAIDKKIILSEQYRMPNNISNWIGKSFYSNQYFTPESNNNRHLLFEGIFSKPLCLVDTSNSKDKLEEKSIGSCFNELEARIVVKILETIISKCNRDILTIAVITPYKSQTDKIREYVRQKNIKLGENCINTVDGFQGKEADVVIYSFTRSNRKSSEKKRIGFLRETRRLNVALTRSKSQLIIIGDFAFLSNCENDDGFTQTENQLKVSTEKHFGILINSLFCHCKSGNGQIIDSEILMEGMGLNA